MNSYELRQEARRQRLEDAADKASREASARFDRAHDMGRMIPMGQPILVGHHSEKGHRNHLKRIDNNMRKGCEANDRAKALSAKAAAVGSGGISSDDPDAPEKLRERIAELESIQERMKAANRAIRKHKKAGAEAQIEALAELGICMPAAARLIEPDFCGRIGYPDYSLQNNNANIRRLKKRAEDMEARVAAADNLVEGETHGDVTLVRNVELNRLQLRFPGKPSPETRHTLKSHGFRWSPSEGAWQRQLNNASEWAAECVLKGVA